MPSVLFASAYWQLDKSIISPRTLEIDSDSTVMLPYAWKPERDGRLRIYVRNTILIPLEYSASARYTIHVPAGRLQYLSSTMYNYHRTLMHADSVLYERSNPAFELMACRSFSRRTLSFRYRGSCTTYDRTSVERTTHRCIPGTYFEQVDARTRGREAVLVRSGVSYREVGHELLEAPTDAS